MPGSAPPAGPRAHEILRFLPEQIPQGTGEGVEGRAGRQHPPSPEQASSPSASCAQLQQAAGAWTQQQLLLRAFQAQGKDKAPLQTKVTFHHREISWTPTPHSC